MTGRIAAALLALAALASAEDCKDCTDGKVCLTHEATDDIAVRGASVKLKTKDMIGKREAIKDLADAQLKHMNVRSRKITGELLKALADADVDVKLLAADKLAELGEPNLAVQGLKQQVANYKKLVGNSKPKKETEIRTWETNLKMLGLMYASLAATKSAPACAVFEEDILESSPWVCAAAANATPPLKGQKTVIRALYEGMRRWLGPSTKAPVPEGFTDAFFAMTRGLDAVVEDPPKGDRSGKNQNQQAAIWDGWWKTNEAKYK